MQPDSRTLVWDAVRAAGLIDDFTRDKSFEDYVSDDLLKSGVERQFEILGEALNRLSRLDAELGQRIPDLPRIVAFRNILVHGYASVDDALVWQLLNERLPALAGVLRSLIAR